MLSSKLFSLVAFAAAAVAQVIPSGDYFISHPGVASSVLEVEGASTRPGAFIVLSHLSRNDTQIWSYSNRTGVFTNKASKLSMEVPRTNGEVQYGTELVQAKPRNENEDDLIQVWAYNATLNQLSSVANPTACITATLMAERATVEECRDLDENDDPYPPQEWEFIPV